MLFHTWLIAGKFVWGIGVLIGSAVTSAIIAHRMRRKVRRVLGRNTTGSDLTSLETWMEVEDIEDRNRSKKLPVN